MEFHANLTPSLCWHMDFLEESKVPLLSSSYQLRLRGWDPLLECQFLNLKMKTGEPIAFLSKRDKIGLRYWSWMKQTPLQIRSDQISRSVMSSSLRPHESQHARPPCPSPTPGVHSDSRPSSQWCHPAISSSVISFSSCPQSHSESESFPMSQLFAWGGQSTGVSASASILPMNIQDWFPLGWTGWIFLQSKGLPRVFSNTTVEKHQLFGAQLSL